jgi:hypothetical protein
VAAAFMTIKRIAPICLGLCLAAVVWLLPPGFFIHQLEYDYLQYWMMAEQIARTGSPAISLAVNLPPFVYASGVSWLYAPAFLVPGGFDEHLRLIQAFNIALICIFFWLALRYIGRAAPFVSLNVVAVLFGLAMLADMRWQLAAMMPNSDTLPAILTVAGCLIAGRPGSARVRFAALFAIGAAGFFVKLSLIALPLAFLIVEYLRRRRRPTGSEIAALAACAAVVAAIAVMNLDVLRAYVDSLVHNPRTPLLGVPPAQTALQLLHAVENLWFASLPGAVIPNQSFLFIDDPYYYSTLFAPHHFTARVVVGLIAGSAISACIVVGAWRLWRTRPYDVVLFLICVVFFALIPNSTSRYLMVFMPFFWVCIIHALHPAWRRIAPRPALLAATAVLALCVIALAEARMLQIRTRGGSPLTSFTYVHDVSRVYDAARTNLANQPPENTRLVFLELPLSVGQFSRAGWSAVTDLPSYSLDRRFPDWARGHRTLAVITCRNPSCDRIPEVRDWLTSRIGPHCYGLRTVFRYRNPAGTAEIDEVIPQRDCPVAT